MAKKVGTLIKEARTGAGFTQEQLARKIKGLSASDISKAERGEKDLTQDQLKAIAKATGVTQKSLLDASKGKKTSSSSPSSSGKTSIKVTAAEKRLVELYRQADSKTRSAAVKMLKEGENGVVSGDNGILGNLLDSAIDALTGSGKKEM